MAENICTICGGCAYRSMKETLYRQKKIEALKQMLSAIKSATPAFDEPLFIDDGQRRRADMEFVYKNNEVVLGFYERGSHNLINVENCPALLPELNGLLANLHKLLSGLCKINVNIRKKKKTEQKRIEKGAVKLLCADNGLDILLEICQTPGLEHRQLIAEMAQSLPDLLRVSWFSGVGSPETIIEKATPELNMAGRAVAVPPGIFLQASETAERKMMAKVVEYMGDVTGKIADLFCGVGTFTYPLAENSQNNILSVDSSGAALQGLQKAINRNQIQNVRILNRNLYKDPLDKDELSVFSALVMDPPRAGAHAQCRQFAQIQAGQRPQKVVFVSCNPKTFVYDAELLINAGYVFSRVALVDQFVYSEHMELVALFEKDSQQQSNHETKKEQKI